MLQTLGSYEVTRPPWGRYSPAMTGHRYEDVDKTEFEVASTKLVYGGPIDRESAAHTPDDVTYVVFRPQGREPKSIMVVSHIPVL